MRVGYHAHSHDFKPVADRIPWEVLFSNAGPDVVMQMDIGNCLDGGGDPVAELKKFLGRSATIHLKEQAARRVRSSAKATCRGKKSSKFVKPRGAPNGTSSSRKATAARRWKALSSAWRISARWGNEPMSGATLTRRWNRVMKLLIGTPPQTISDLICAMGVTRTAVAEQLNELLAAGLVESAVRSGCGPRPAASRVPGHSGGDDFALCRQPAPRGPGHSGRRSARLAASGWRQSAQAGEPHAGRTLQWPDHRHTAPRPAPPVYRDPQRRGGQGQSLDSNTYSFQA